MTAPSEILAASDKKDYMSLLKQLTRILEHSHNAYSFRYRYKSLQIIIEKVPDGSIVAYYEQPGNRSI